MASSMSSPALIAGESPKTVLLNRPAGLEEGFVLMELANVGIPRWSVANDHAQTQNGCR